MAMLQDKIMLSDDNATNVTYHDTMDEVWAQYAAYRDPANSDSGSYTSQFHVTNVQIITD